MEWLTLLAIVLGPILAVQAQKWIERGTEEKRERQFIFRTLMRTRSNFVSREHVDALNMIPLVFSKENRRDTEVRKKWEIYLNHRRSAVPPDPSEVIQREFANKGVTLLSNLLLALAKSLNYNLDQNDLERIYSPQLHVMELQENQEARMLLLQLLRGNSALKIQASTGSDPSSYLPFSH